MEYTQQDLLDAVNALIDETKPGYILQALEAIWALQTKFPVEFRGDLAYLNPLVFLHHQDPEKLTAVKGLIDRKRHGRGLPPCWPVHEAKFDKASYQKTLMAQRRARAYEAVDIENMQRPEKDALTGPRRLEFERKQLADWGEGCRAALEAARTAPPQGKTPKEWQDDVRTEFWKRVDADLAQRRELVRVELLKPPHQRRKV